MKAMILVFSGVVILGCKPKTEEQPESTIASSYDGDRDSRQLEGTWQTECVPPFLRDHPQFTDPRKVGAIKTIQFELNTLRYKVNFYDNSRCTGGITSQATLSGEARIQVTGNSFTAREMGLNDTSATSRPIEYDVDSLLTSSASSRPAEWYYSKVRIVGDHLWMSAQISPNMGNTDGTRSRGFLHEGLPYEEFHYRRGIRYSE